MKHLGIDIGTTTICGAVIASDGSLAESITERNRSFMGSPHAWERIQDPEVIIRTVFSLAERLIQAHPDVASIGLSGQMHGILYTDADGNHVSPLYTWQDGRGNLPHKGNQSYVDCVEYVSGYRMATGYGAVTHFYNAVNGLLPTSAAALCTIADYAVMRLCGLKRPLIHASNAASIGCFDLKALDFDRITAGKLSIAPTLLPSVTTEATVVGHYCGIPVSVAIGDNQASFIGSGADEASVLVNVGTGSQVSLVSGYTEAEGSIELRPFVGERYLLVGSSLSGGRAYALLEQFFRSVVGMAGVQVDSMYPYMAQALECCADEPKLSVSSLFSGSRDEPAARGAIDGIGIDNFTPEALMLGFLDGIADELYSMYRKMGSPAKAKLIGSGNGIRSNPALAAAFEKRFGKPLTLAECEEAAAGAALFGRDAMNK